MRPHSGQITAAAKLIAAARRPVLYVGGGVLKARATEVLRQLAELTGIPVVTTLMARGAFPDSHIQHIGMPGMHGTVTAVAGMQRADVIVALGARFDDRVTGQLSTFAPGATVIHADIDPAEIGKNRVADVPIVGDAREVITELITAVSAEQAAGVVADLTAWWAELDELRETFPLGYDWPSDGSLSPQYVIERLGKIAGPDAIYAAGVGQHQMWAAQFISYEKPGTWLNSGGLGTMGYAVPAAMGAKMGRPDATVWAIDGDGCFQMTNQELATCAIEGIPIKVAIINNGNLGMVRQWQTLFYGERYSQTDLGTHKHRIPDFKLLAEAYGCLGPAVRVQGGRRQDDRGGDGGQRPAGGRRLRGRRGRPGVADGGRRHRQRPDHGRPRHPAALRRRMKCGDDECSLTTNESGDKSMPSATNDAHR